MLTRRILTQFAYFLRSLSAILIVATSIHVSAEEPNGPAVGDEIADLLSQVHQNNAPGTKSLVEVNARAKALWQAGKFKESLQAYDDLLNQAQPILEQTEP